MNNALRTLFRLVFCLWFGAVLACAAAVSWKTQTQEEVGSLLTFLFTRYVAPPTPTIMPVHTSMAPPPPVTVVESPKIPEYPLLPRGRNKGKGTLETWSIKSLDGAMEIHLPYSGQLGEMTSFTGNSNQFRSVDLHGDWTTTPSTNKHIKDPLFKLVQLGYHKDFIRISVSRTDPKNIKPLFEEVRYSPTEIIMRFYE